jgi:hypothetical protein
MSGMNSMDYVIEDAGYCEKHHINFMTDECPDCEQLRKSTEADNNED